MGIVRLSGGDTDRERRDPFCSEMNNTVLVLNATFHLNKAFVQHDHRIKTVDVGHHNHVGVASLIFQSKKNEALGSSGPLTSDDATGRHGGPVVRKFPEFAR